jgi:osmotically inducible protein OsmC
MATTRTATTTWQGSLFEGSGSVSLDSSGIGTYDVSWPSRTEEPNGLTSPEELIAAAHASCFAMSLSLALGQAGTPPESLHVNAAVTFVPGTGITTSQITVTATVPGMSADDFAAAAEEAKTSCPVSNALAGVEIGVEATLA